MAKLSLYLIWILWGLSWLGAMLWSAPVVKRAALGHQIAYRVLVFAGFLLLSGIWSPRYAAMTQFWRLGDGAQWLLDLTVVLGFGLSWWARASLGDLWSAGITRKQNHHVIQSGPYAWMRHPLYTGIVIAAFATAILQGSLVAIAGAIVMALGWSLKAKLEEDFLRAELGQAYDDYADRTAMLVPFLF